MKSLTYFALCSEEISPGVAKKIKGFVVGAQKNGLKSNFLFIKPNGFKNHLILFKKIISSNKNINVVRFQGTFPIFLLISGLVLKLRRKKLITDIPTPITNLIREIYYKQKKSLKDYLVILQLYVIAPFSLIFSSIVIQYSREPIWFNLFSYSKVIKIGNGIDVESIPFDHLKIKWPAKNIVFAGVGTIGLWHGYDRFIRAIKILKDDKSFNHNIIFNIIGDGSELYKLKKLVSDLNLFHEVKFKGMLFAEDLYKEYTKSHFGVGSLGWHRVRVQEASPLKIREYLSAGLPVITATQDPDFTNKYEFYIEVSEGEEIDSIVDTLRKIVKKDYPNPIECRIFSQKFLDYKIKVNKILSTLV